MMGCLDFVDANLINLNPAASAETCFDLARKSYGAVSKMGV
jgi:hypothetical protein